ncbi:MAG: VirB4-like conjugal transfer ATPase, CD1110 family [Minisyncoccia bacterium]
MEIKLKKPYQPSKEDIINIIAPSGMEINANEIKLGNYYARTFFIFTYPRYITSGWFSPIINLPEMMDISIFIHPADTSQILKKLKKTVTELESQLADREAKGLVRDPALETAYHDVESLRDSLIQSTEKLFDVGVYITIYAPTIDDLNHLEAQLISLVESKLIEIKPALFRTLDGFNSTLPICKDKLGVLTPLNSSPASSLFPFVSPDLTSNKGILYGINMHNNTLVIFDRFSLENANMVVFAKSGAGKSYTVKLEIIRSLMLGTDIIIIDPEDEYRALSDAIGGTYFKISLTSPNHINPLDIPIIPEGEEPSDVFKSHILNLTGLLKLMLGEISPEEDALIDRVLNETYAARDITPENFGSKELQPPLLGDLQTVLENTEGGHNLAVRLDKFVHGSYAGFTNSPTNIDINNRLIVFSIRDLEEELRPIAMYIILNFVWNLIRAKLKKRLLVIDEAWWMMKYKDSALFLFGLVKRARKYYLGVTTISQDVADFLNSDYGRPIVTNSTIQVLLKQAPASIPILTQTFNLTKTEQDLLLQANVGEGLFFAGLKHVAIQIKASYTEDQVITTNPEQLLKIKGVQKQNG